MDPLTANRFRTEFAPRIMAAIATHLGRGTHVAVMDDDGAEHPLAIVVSAPARERTALYPHSLNLRFTWDPDEVASLMDAHGEARFGHYLDALPRKLAAWASARGIDFASRTQTEPAILLGNLDFEG